MSEAKAKEAVNATFAASGGEWFCAQQSGGHAVLVELRHPGWSMRALPISETDGLNGVTERFIVYVTCDQHRVRDVHWSEWTQGTPGVQQFAVALMAGLGGFWSERFEKKNGVWSAQQGLGAQPLIQDLNLVRRLMSRPEGAPSPSQPEVPTLARIKASAEAGDAEAQYSFARSFGVGSEGWKRWINASAAQGYGPAEDDLACTGNWMYFSSAYTNPNMRAYLLKTRGAELRQALILAASAADKGFEHSRTLLAQAYVFGILLPQDRIEAYKWFKLGQASSYSRPNTSPNDDLVTTMSLDEVREGEARAASYRPGNTTTQIRDVLVISKLKLTGLASNGNERIAVVNSSRLKVGQDALIAVEGITVQVHCLSIDSNSVVLSLPSDGARVTLRMGGAVVISRPLNPAQ